jgi:hypothetical protein
VDHNFFAALRLCENEKEKKYSSQSREGAKASGSQYAEARIRRGGREVNHNFFAALRLPTAGRSLRE